LKSWRKKQKVSMSRKIFNTEYLDQQEKPEAISLDGIRTGQGGTLWRKELIREGTFYPDRDEEVAITLDMLEGWIEQFNRMKQNGVEVPFYLGHVDPDCKSNPNRRVGTLLEVALGKNTQGGTSLYGKCWFRPGVDYSASQVSIYAEPDVRDGMNSDYDYPITHVAITDRPVCPGLSPFKALAFSLQKSEKLLREAKACGMEKQALSMGLLDSAFRVAWNLVRDSLRRALILGKRALFDAVIGVIGGMVRTPILRRWPKFRYYLDAIAKIASGGRALLSDDPRVREVGGHWWRAAGIRIWNLDKDFQRDLHREELKARKELEEQKRTEAGHHMNEMLKEADSRRNPFASALSFGLWSDAGKILEGLWVVAKKAAKLPYKAALFLWEKTLKLFANIRSVVLDRIRALFEAWKIAQAQGVSFAARAYASLIAFIASAFNALKTQRERFYAGTAKELEETLMTFQALMMSEQLESVPSEWEHQVSKFKTRQTLDPYTLDILALTKRKLEEAVVKISIARKAMIDDLVLYGTTKGVSRALQQAVNSETAVQGVTSLPGKARFAAWLREVGTPGAERLIEKLEHYWKLRQGYTNGALKRIARRLSEVFSKAKILSFSILSRLSSLAPIAGLGAAGLLLASAANLLTRVLSNPNATSFGRTLDLLWQALKRVPTSLYNRFFRPLGELVSKWRNKLKSTPPGEQIDPRDIKAIESAFAASAQRLSWYTDETEQLRSNLLQMLGSILKQKPPKSETELLSLQSQIDESLLFAQELKAKGALDLSGAIDALNRAQKIFRSEFKTSWLVIDGYRKKEKRMTRDAITENDEKNLNEANKKINAVAGSLTNVLKNAYRFAAGREWNEGVQDFVDPQMLAQAREKLSGAPLSDGATEYAYFAKQVAEFLGTVYRVFGEEVARAVELESQLQQSEKKLVESRYLWLLAINEQAKLGDAKPGTSTYAVEVMRKANEAKADADSTNAIRGQDLRAYREHVKKLPGRIEGLFARTSQRGWEITDRSNFLRELNMTALEAMSSDTSPPRSRVLVEEYRYYKSAPFRLVVKNKVTGQVVDTGKFKFQIGPLPALKNYFTVDPKKAEAIRKVDPDFQIGLSLSVSGKGRPSGTIKHPVTGQVLRTTEAPLKETLTEEQQSTSESFISDLQKYVGKLRDTNLPPQTRDSAYLDLTGELQRAASKLTPEQFRDLTEIFKPIKNAAQHASETFKQDAKGMRQAAVMIHSALTERVKKFFKKYGVKY